jgi:ribulose-phosphate 3-epimerase
MGIRITPSILNADFSRLDEEISRIAAVSDLLHLDVMDNVFVPNFTFDFEQAAAIIGSSPIPVDSHLMIADVDRLGPAYAHAGSASVTIHAEASSSISRTLRAIKAEGSRAGLALKPGSSIADYADCVDDVDMFLIMTVEPGFGGQKFMSTMMEKVSATKDIIGDRPIWLQVDGGVSLETIEIAREAGADTFVAGSAVFNSPDPAEMITQLRSLAEGK